ncbi:hypothetical protein [Sodalis praecaptivus]|uniref:hypothetical protein n=1 Tax=Sodalis praecaptivus TaxID=1239307 RepID=UPI0027EDCA4A|nr:hypothetical protein [Sodalis praecaptivus]CAJ0994961.1 hypothetical protein NVIRENTERO_01683 [Sodalis praecaptivus]
MTMQKPTENYQSSISNHNKNRIKSLLLYCASFVALTTIYYYFSTFFGLNSDRASVLLEAKDILNGNIFLDGWYLSTVPFYFTETLPLAFLSLLFSPKSFLLHLMPALYYSLVVLLSFNLMRKKNKSCTPFIGLMLIPSPFFASNSITACVHIGAIIVGLVIINSYTKINSPITKVMLSLITGLALYSDNLLLYFLIIPIIMATTISILKKRRIDEFVHAIIPIGSILFSKIINLYFYSINSFVMPITEPPHFATLEQFGFNLKLMIEALLKLFGADILGGSVTDTTTIMALINIIIIPCFFIMTIKAIKTNNTFEFVDYILLSSSVMLPAAFLASNTPSDMGSSRYLIPPIISFVIFIGRNAKMPTQKHQLLTVGAIIFCGINCYKFSKSNNYDTSHLVAEYLKNNNFSEGFANYWRASSSSVIMDNGNTVIAPVNVNTIDGKIYAYKWLSNSKWFDLQSRYIILNSDEQLHALTRKFGDDAYIKKINDTYIVIYKDKRLSITG